MTVTVNRSRVQYTGNGSTTAFSVTFNALTQAEIVVTVTTSGVDSVKTLGTHYSLTTAPFATGTVTFLTSPTDYTPASGTTITISRSLDFKQETDYQANDALDAETLEEGYDKAMMAAQQLDDDKNRTLKYSATLTDDFAGDDDFTTISASSTDRASKYLSFDSSGKLSVVAEVTGLIAVETSVAVGDVLTYNGSQWVNSKILARLSQILDSNGNESLKFVTTGSAVNEVTITNAATTNAPEISATGGDDNIDVDITPKGTGELNVDGKVKSINGQSFTHSAFHGALILGF
jgi:hypothetical protein